MVRRVVFWLHLVTGLGAGAVIVVMSITGALLAFGPQIVERAERALWTAPAPSADAVRRPLARLVAAAQERQGGQRATTVSARAGAAAPVRVGFGRGAAWFVNPYTGEMVGGSCRTLALMHTIEDWHRWLGSRELGRPVTGAGNLAFLGLALSGLYLWWPRSWSRATVRAVTVLAVRHRGRARDFNWHNTIGFWCAPVLVVLTLTGVVMSYSWASDLLYRLTGDEPPSAPAAAPRAERGARGAGERGARGRELDLDLVWARAAQQVPDWVLLTLRLPQRAGAPVTVLVQRPPTWHPSPRSVLTLDGSTAQVLAWEPFDGASAGRTLRMLARVLHTGEVGGVPGQVVAGVASAGGAALVITGVSLACRRASAWSARRRRATIDQARTGVASTS